MTPVAPMSSNAPAEDGFPQRAPLAPATPDGDGGAIMVDGGGQIRLAGKTILITAAGQGMGRATAVACLKEGAEVVATDIGPALLRTCRMRG